MSSKESGIWKCLFVMVFSSSYANRHVGVSQDKHILTSVSGVEDFDA